MNQEESNWRECSSCKKGIAYNTKYYECSVSTCNGFRTGYVFCSVPCWERHVPGAKHRDASAIEKMSPKKENIQVRRIVAGAASTHTTSVVTGAQKNVDNEILVVVSKVKAYIKSQADMNVSDEIMETLSTRIRFFCDEAIKKARSDGRKTVLDRDMR
ncbi:MAG: hypothetical protein L6Q37_12070 [Bdellovibrionaceae bacterium]|nr:hypothetical protein [Pseudobdellovibrionaceae bacterium]NUM58800.1 hypothetical protein [Pseudobdellovibrionaceae bacterium]